MDRLRERGADVLTERVVGGKRFIGALEDDDVLLSLESGHDGSFREGTDHVDVDGADGNAAGLAQVVDGGFDVLGSRAERDEDGVGVVGLVLGQEAVVAAGEIAEVLVGVFQELKNRLGEVVAPGDDALHVVLLILHRAKQDGVGQVHHLGDAAPRGAEEDALCFRGAVNDVFGRAEILADQFGLVLIEGALQVGGQEPVHDVHAGGERELGDAAQD